MAERDSIIIAFPKLASDNSFKITSPCDVKYNCIAWAYGMYKDRWMQAYPSGFIALDGVVYWWPDSPKTDRNIKHYIEAFEKRGFVLCKDYTLEEGFLKVALYINPATDECSHASRQKNSGVWISKLGPQFDIEHGTPFSLEGSSYGNVFCCMKTKR